MPTQKVIIDSYVPNSPYSWVARVSPLVLTDNVENAKLFTNEEIEGYVLLLNNTYGQRFYGGNPTSTPPPPPF